MQIKNVEVLGGAKVEWRQSDDAVEMQLPRSAAGKYAYVLKVSVAP